ncbi:MAG: hypothetical protein SPD91_02265 [Streptococcus hyointestinalis]|uniref:hypothetical protein n=1 Tax=Streptococcus hyointestinalis TaxID=1337 RepID=UPI0023F42BB0|nr:hypothetical protein [Streptococcus hyointestinalis]MCI6871117.1 hypothetical protein [Streptococcus hyointestinalis]MDD7355469.1 hypothetical protein [Streptococcus hyointestinalis]MDY4553278.1 hypothetical protein [Streptococcus hyointestinalis]
MEKSKPIYTKITEWFKSLTRAQQVIAVGLVAVLLFFGIQMVTSNQLNGTYTGTREGANITLSIQGTQGRLVIKKDSEVVADYPISNIDEKTGTLTLSSSSSSSSNSQQLSFKHEGKTFKILEGDGDEFISVSK